MMKKTIYSLMILLSLFACKKDEEAPDNTTTPTPTTSVTDKPYYFTAKFDGKKVAIGTSYNTVSFNSYGNGAGGYGSSEDVGYANQPYTFFTTLKDLYNGSVTKPWYNIGFIKVTEYEAYYQEELEALISTGTYTYGDDGSDDSPSDKAIDGAFLEYLDPVTEKRWTTYYGTADQTGSTFEVTEYIDNPKYGSDGILKLFTATFNCKLYDTEGNSITVTNGKVRGRILVYY